MPPLPRTPATAAALLAGLGLFTACGRPAGPGARNRGEQGVQERELASVRVARAEKREMLRLLETTSKLESEREIEVVPRVSGLVLALHAEEGDSVQAGDALATLEDVEQTLAVKDAEVALQEARNALEKLRLAQRESEARVERCQVALDQARRDHERNQRLFEGASTASALSQSALEASQLALDVAGADKKDAELARERARLELAAGETAVERAQITLERARLALGYTRISAPFAGVVARRDVKVGDSVGPQAPAFVLTDVSLLRAVFSRPQEELELFARAAGGANGEGRLAISATADAFPGRVFPGWVERISPTIDAQSGQFRVTGRLECSQDGGRVKLLPGMLVRLSIIIDRHPEALVVPKRALEREGERRYLLLAVPAEGGHRVRRVEVLEGFAEDQHVEVQPRDGAALAPGDAVIVVGGKDLDEGEAILVDEERAQESGTLAGSR